MPLGRRGRGAWAAGWLAVVLAGGGGSAFVRSLHLPVGAGAALAAEPHAPLRAPQHLSDTGLYLPDGRVDPRNRPFEPQYPLWTDGARKSRWVRLPEGTTIDVSDLDDWRFPPGTTFWKEFAWGERKVETRMIRVSEGGEWTFATYVWNEAQTDADLAPDDGVAAAFEFAPGRRHSIPSSADCITCHRSHAAVILGFNALQLSDDRDPLAPHAGPLHAGDVTLATLEREGRLSPGRPDLVARPPRIRERDPVARAAIGYLSANCGGCHHPNGPLARLGFSLRHDDAAALDAPEPARVTTAGVRGRFVVPGADPGGSQLVSAGDPARSAIAYRMASRRPASQMPPLGSVVADTAAVTLVRRWIEDLRGPVGAVPGGRQGS